MRKLFLATNGVSEDHSREPYGFTQPIEVRRGRAELAACKTLACRQKTA